MDSDEKTDDELALACLGGDLAAFTQLVRRHELLLRTVAYAVTGSTPSMEDALQEGLLKAYLKLASYHPGSDFRAWLCRVVRNAALDEVRKNKRRPSTELSGDITDPTQVADDVSRRLDVTKAIFRLPEKQRSALLLVDSLGLDYASAGAVLHIPAGTVASRVNSARSALRLSLAPTYKDDER
jgi:RNA polymerase sigma-70 factor (ECF subfamily)